MAKKVIIFIIAYFIYVPALLGGIAVAVLVAADTWTRRRTQCQRL